MKPLLPLISYLGLALSLLPSFLVAAGMISRQTSHAIMFVGMLMWFGTAVIWIKPPEEDI